LFTHTQTPFEELQRRHDDRDSAPVKAHHDVALCRRADPRRAEAEAYVRARFHKTHGAQVVTFMPTFLLMQNAGGCIEAVLGFQRAEDSPLYLERYLDRPIEQMIASRTGARVRRSRIVEIGNFAATDSRAAGTFMSFLAPHFLACDATWIAFTATSSIRKILASLGAGCTDLGAADASLAANGPDQWGRYYSHAPRVMAGYLPLARRIPSLWNNPHAD
jgi:hypothetical protein